MDNLPIQLHHHLAKYLGPRDLQNMRLMNKKWNGVAKDKLQGQGFNFIFQDVQMLIEFNTIFVNYDPPEYLSTSKFTFMLPVLASIDALPHLNTFEQTFGTSVTRLVLNFDKPEYANGSWATVQEKATVNRHVTLLLSSVKNQIVQLQFQGYTGLDPLVLGPGPFPVLGTVKIQNSDRYAQGHPDRRNAGYVAAGEEACVLELSQKIPAIQNFAFERYVFCEYKDSPTYLPAVLENLFHVNPNVLTQLEFYAAQFAGTDPTSPSNIRAAQFVEAVTGSPIKISELTTATSRNETEEGLRTILGFISRNADTLKKITFLDGTASGHGLKFPPLPVLKELTYFQWTQESLLGFDSAERYPNLRKVSTFFTGNDFLVPHPTVLDLTLDLMPYTGCGLYAEGIRDPAELGRRILANFPNITNLTCNATFLEFQSFYNFSALKKLKITRNSFIDADRFWASATQNAPKIPFDQIRALEAPAEREIVTDRNGNVLHTFQDIKNLEELIVLTQSTGESKVIESLDAIIYASKFKKLQRLHKVVIQYFCSTRTQVPKAYLDELKKYHDDVIVEQVPIY